MKKNAGSGAPERKKPTKERTQRNATVAKFKEAGKAFETVNSTWQAVAEMHNANNQVLTTVKPLAELIKRQDVLTNIPEEAKKELVTTVKNITDTTLKMKEFQQEAKETLLAQKPKRATNPDDPDRLDENLALLTTGAKYQEWSDRFTMDVVPDMVTVLDIITTTHPDANAIPELQVMRDAFPQQKEVSDHAE